MSHYEIFRLHNLVLIFFSFGSRSSLWIFARKRLSVLCVSSLFSLPKPSTNRNTSWSEQHVVCTLSLLDISWRRVPYFKTWYLCSIMPKIHSMSICVDSSHSKKDFLHRSIDISLDALVLTIPTSDCLPETMLLNDQLQQHFHICPIQIIQILCLPSTYYCECSLLIYQIEWETCHCTRLDDPTWFLFFVSNVSLLHWSCATEQLIWILFDCWMSNLDNTPN